MREINERNMPSLGTKSGSAPSAGAVALLRWDLSAMELAARLGAAMLAIHGPRSESVRV